MRATEITPQVVSRPCYYQLRHRRRYWIIGHLLEKPDKRTTSSVHAPEQMTKMNLIQINSVLIK